VRKQSREPKKARNDKKTREVAERLTFLEKLVMRALPARRVPAESGVQFAISSNAKNDGLCLLFLVDDANTPIVEDGPRPDYLVVHASRAGCLLTIIEMKGREEKNVEHGVEQIRAMYRRLRAEMAQCLPGSCRRVRIQGVLLMPQNAQINVKKIEEARREGVEILPLQFHHQAELYPYISKPVSRTERYTHQRLPRSHPELNSVERLIAEGKLERRIRDAFFDERRATDEDTFFLSFRRPGDERDAYVSLSATTNDAIIAFSKNADECYAEVSKHLDEKGLQCPALRMATI
jgi:hypothetical protein